ncbi:MAG TPA: hypothetical protein DDY43_04490 [Synechococcales bacterium UBA10510]|nr:hypothetical protein [Synechococcales bacterium UBA10510]
MGEMPGEQPQAHRQPWITRLSAAGGAGSAADPLRLKLKCLPYQLRRQVGSFAAFKPYLDCSH